MSKIIAVSDDIIKVGTDDGKIKEARREDVSFEPHVGDKVDIFEDENSIVITKAEEEKVVENSAQGINININNENTNGTNSGTYAGDGKKVVNKVAYVLLAFFLGGLGAHKFYAGKIGTGVCYLLFCWTYVPALIAFIEAIVALCAKSDSNGNIVV